jgi:hypothetical protein
MRIGLHSGAWTNFGSFTLAGAGAVIGATTAQRALQSLGWVGMAFGLAILLWGITIDGQHWWRRFWPKRPIPADLVAESKKAYEVERARQRAITDAERQRERHKRFQGFITQTVRGVARPIKFMGLALANDTPIPKHTAIRLIVRNESPENLTGLVAQLVRAEPELAAYPNQFHLPLTLATKTRLDKLRNPSLQQVLPAAPFSLNAGAEKQIEVVWLYSDGSLEAKITHEAGEEQYVVMGSHTLYVEVSGGGRPVIAPIHIEVTDEETGAWKATLMDEQGAGK